MCQKVVERLTWVYEERMAVARTRWCLQALGRFAVVGGRLRLWATNWLWYVPVGCHPSLQGPLQLTSHAALHFYNVRAYEGMMPEAWVYGRQDCAISAISLVAKEGPVACPNTVAA